MVTDSQLVNPYRIHAYRKNKWRNHEQKPVKDHDLLDDLDRIRRKLATIVGGRVEINYKREKNNRIADKLSKKGKTIARLSRSIIKKKMRNVAARKFAGAEISYSILKQGNQVEVRIYAWELVQDKFEISAEIVSGAHQGKKIKIYVDPKIKAEIHRHHQYMIEIENVLLHSVTVVSWNEIPASSVALPPSSV